MTGGAVSGRPTLRDSTLTLAPEANGAAAFLLGGNSHLAGQVHPLQDVLIQGNNFTSTTVVVADTDLLIEGLLTLRSEQNTFQSRLNLNGHTLAIAPGGRLNVEGGKVLHPQNAWLDVDDDGNPIVSLVDFSVAGNITETYTIAYDLSDFDDTPPVTRIIPRAPFAFVGPDTLIVTPTTVMLLAATDDASGVASISLSIDGGAPEQNRPFFFAAGTHTVAFQSEDRRGNLEALRTTTVIVDDESPALTFTAPALLVPHPENLPLAFDFDVDDDTDPAPAVTATLVRSGGGDLFTVIDEQVLAPSCSRPAATSCASSAATTSTTPTSTSSAPSRSCPGSQRPRAWSSAASPTAPSSTQPSRPPR